MIKKILFVFLASVTILLLKAPQAQATTLNVPSFPLIFDIPNSAKIQVYPALGTDQLKMTFSNLIFAKKISYELTYTHSGINEGAMGEFKPRTVFPVVKTIMLGTCSTGGHCVLHTGLSNVKLKVTTHYSLFDKTEVTNYTIL